MPLVEYYQEVALPALAFAQVDVTRGVMDRSRQVEVRDSVERVVADLSDHVAVPDEETENGSSQAVPDVVAATGADEQSVEIGSRILCIAGRTPLDQAACAILAQLLERRSISARVAGPEALTTGGIFALKANGAQSICVFYLDHRSLAAVRYSVRRLRKKFVNIPIAVCLWGSTDLSSMADAARADATVNSLQDTIDFCVRTSTAEASREDLSTAPVVLGAA
jgi:hypothetical protein